MEANDVVVFSGMAEWNGVALTMAREGGPSVEIPAEWLVRLKPVEPHLRTMLLNAEYCFSVSVGDLGPDDDRSAFQQTGLKWPSDDRAG